MKLHIDDYYLQKIERIDVNQALGHLREGSHVHPRETVGAQDHRQGPRLRAGHEGPLAVTHPQGMN